MRDDDGILARKLCEGRGDDNGSVCLCSFTATIRTTFSSGHFANTTANWYVSYDRAFACCPKQFMWIFGLVWCHVVMCVPVRVLVLAEWSIVFSIANVVYDAKHGGKAARDKNGPAAAYLRWLEYNKGKLMLPTLKTATRVADACAATVTAARELVMFKRTIRAGTASSAVGAAALSTTKRKAGNQFVMTLTSAKRCSVHLSATRQSCAFCTLKTADVAFGAGAGAGSGAGAGAGAGTGTGAGTVVSVGARAVAVAGSTTAMRKVQESFDAIGSSTRKAVAATREKVHVSPC